MILRTNHQQHCTWEQWCVSLEEGGGGGEEYVKVCIEIAV